MNTTATANWPLFATNQDNRVDRIDRIDIQVNGQPNDPLKNFNKMIAQNNINSNISPNLSNDYQKPDDLSVNSQLHRNHQQTHNNENKQQPQQQSHVYGNRNGKLIDVSADGSHDEFDDEDMDDDVGSIDDVDSLSSHDNIYDTSYNSNDSNRNDSNERFSAANSKDDISNDEQKVNDDQAIGPLAQLQNAVERRTGILGMRLTDFSTPNGTTPSLFGGGINFSANSINPIGMSSLQYSEDKNGEVYRCHLCSYSGTSKDHFNVHMDTHFDHKCPYCDYTSRTEGRLKRHIRDFHSENPPESWAGTRVLKESTSNDGDDSADPNDGSGGNGGSGSKSRKYKCKQCEFVATCKQEFWEHSKSHIKAEKLLTCPKCNFVTEYKHHLEYHLRNHFGSKPFKCGKCNYSCVNKSMLNSHMKSHSNIYQYRCADCSYATKYCHSLKLHLRKYSHKPATVLNLDGTPNPYPVIDVYGTRRGPRPKRPKNREHHYNHHNERSLSATQTPILTSPISPNLVNTAIPPLIPTSMPMGLPFIYPPTATTFGLLGPQAIPQIPHMPNNHQMPHHLYEQSSHSSHSAANTNLQCNLCDFSTNIREQFGRHLLIHVSNENKEFYKMYGTDQTQMIQHNAIINELVARQSPNSKKFLEQIAINPAFINTLMSMNSLPKSEPMMALEWHSPKGSTDIHDNNGTPSPHNTIMNFKDNRSESDQMESQRLNEMISPLSSNSTAEHEKYIKQKVLSDERKRVVHMETVPLDLSSTKSTSPLTNDNMFISHLPFMERKHDRTPPSDVTAQQQQQHHSPPPQQHSRANRRKGRAYKLNVNRISLHTNDDHFNSVELTDDDVSHSSESIREDSDHESIANESVFNTNFQVQLSVNNTTKSVGDLLSKEGKDHKEEYTCNACEITFKDSIMYTMHIGYHDHNDPYTCNSCGQHFSDKFSFYVHLHRASHK